MSKGEYLIVPKGMKFKGSGKLGLKNYDFCEYVKFGAISLKFDIL